MTSRPNRKSSTEIRRATDPAIDISSLDKLLGFRLRLLEQEFMRSFARHMQPLELTPTLYSILVLIRDNPGCRQAELSQALRMHQPNLVERVGLLANRGLIVRREDPTDGRAAVFELSFAGRHFMEKVTAAHEAHEQEMRARLGHNRYRCLFENAGADANDID